MKKLIVFLWLLAGCMDAQGQTDSMHVWNRYCIRKDTTVLFAGANNIIAVYNPAYKPAQLKIKSLDRALRIGTPEAKGDTLEIMAMPYPDKGKNMRLAIVNSKTGKVLKTINFTSEHVPPVAARVGNITGTEALRKDILAQTAIRCYYPNSLYGYPYKINQFTFKINTDSVKAVISVQSALLTKGILQQIKTAPAGTIVEFTDIVATCPDCVTKTLENIKLKIK